MIECNKPIEKWSMAMVSLSARGLRNVRVEAQDFTFVTRSHSHPCSCFLAEFISPRVSDMRQVDETIHEFVIDIDDPTNVVGQFISSVIRGECFLVDLECQVTLASVCSYLQNAELYELAFGSESEEVSTCNVIPRILRAFHENLSIDRELDFLASHFVEFIDSSSQFETLPFSLISAVISHPKLKVESEDSLYKFIADAAIRNSEYSALFEFVQFAYLTAETISEFAELVSNSFELMTVSLWKSVVSRLSLDVSPRELHELGPNSHLLLPKPRGRDFPYSHSSPFDGIIAYLTQEHDGNVHDRGILKVTGSSQNTVWGNADPKHAADLQAPTYFGSANLPDQWLCYDFQKLRLTPSGYSIRSEASGQNWCHLKNWVIEGSDDGVEWAEIDRRVDDTKLNGGKAFAYYPIEQSGEYRMIRLRQIGPNHHGRNDLLLSALEIYGALVE